MGRLDGKVAVITGSGRGIGSATAKLFAQQGAAVVVNDVDPEPAEETAQTIKDAGGEVLVSTDNTVNMEEARRMMDAAANQFGKIDILVNNAGITRDKTFHNMDDEIWNFVLDINLKTAFHGQGRHHLPDQDPGPRARALPHQRQRRCSGLHRDPADRVEGPGGRSGGARGQPADGPLGHRPGLLRPARGRGQGPPVPGVRGSRLHLGRDPARLRRDAGSLSPWR